MALFAVNTGCRDAEICSLKWAREVPVPQPATTVFIIPGERVKNGQDRLVVLNDVARDVVDRQRGNGSDRVVLVRGRPALHELGADWRRAREAVGLPQVRVHDLKHTFGRRLRAAGVSLEDRQDLIGHRLVRVTTHYSLAEFNRLRTVAYQVCDRDGVEPELLVLRVRDAALLQNSRNRSRSSAKGQKAAIKSMVRTAGLEPALPMENGF